MKEENGEGCTEGNLFMIRLSLKRGDPAYRSGEVGEDHLYKGEGKEINAEIRGE